MATQPTHAATDDRPLLLRIIEEGYDRATWNDTNLRSAIKGVTAREAAWRPDEAAHSIAEIVLHCAYWKATVRRRITGDAEGGFPLDGSNWFVTPEKVTDARWRRWIALLDDAHAKLREAVERAERPIRYQGRPGQALARQVFGIAMHDVYHTGQIHLLRAMYARHAGRGVS